MNCRIAHLRSVKSTDALLSFFPPGSPLETCGRTLPAKGKRSNRWKPQETSSVLLPQMLGSQHHWCKNECFKLGFCCLFNIHLLKIFERIRNASDKEKTSSVLVRLEQKKNWVPEYLAASIRPHHCHSTLCDRSWVAYRDWRMAWCNKHVFDQKLAVRKFQSLSARDQLRRS